MKHFTFVDLFAGIGGFKIGLARNGGRCVGFSEIEKDAITAYCRNFDIDEGMNLGDITAIQGLPEHDILTAGVPCQSWSIAGKNLGFDDDRGQLWNDTIYLLKQSQPRAFIFENVKGLVDPRNAEALSHILTRIQDAGYSARHFVLNSYDYGVPQNRVRVYIIGFRDADRMARFDVPKPVPDKVNLADILGIETADQGVAELDLFGEAVGQRRMSMSSTNGYNDYFLFNDIRNGRTTIHSWDLIETTDRQKQICYTLLKNRRRRLFGPLDGNPLSVVNFQNLNSSITKGELDELVALDILSTDRYLYRIPPEFDGELTADEQQIAAAAEEGVVNVDALKLMRHLKVAGISITKTMDSLVEKGAAECIEERYDFKHRKISTGLHGINRIFLPSSDIFSTLVASDTNDYITPVNLEKKSHEQYKRDFIEEVFRAGNYRRLTKEEACRAQGFPETFKLPESRGRWMKLIGNSVSVPVIESLCAAILKTGVMSQEKVTA